MGGPEVTGALGGSPEKRSRGIFTKGFPEEMTLYQEEE